MISDLKTLLANLYVMNYKVQAYHWNVVGSDFVVMHDFFGEIYEELQKEIDGVAELIRTLGDNPPQSILELYKLKSITEDQNLVKSSSVMINTLIEDNSMVMTNIEQMFFNYSNTYVAETDYLSVILGYHKKLNWMLRSING